MEQSSESPATAGVTPQDDAPGKVATPWGELPEAKTQADGTAPISQPAATTESANDIHDPTSVAPSPHAESDSAALAKKANDDAMWANLHRPHEPGTVTPNVHEQAGQSNAQPAAEATDQSAKHAEEGATSDEAKAPQGANAALESENAARLFPDGSVESAVASGHASVKAAEIPEDKGEHGKAQVNEPRNEESAPTSAAETGDIGTGTVKSFVSGKGTAASLQPQANTLTPGGIKTPSGLPTGVEPPKPPEDPKSEALVEDSAPLNTRSEATTAADVKTREDERGLETGVDYAKGTDPKTVNVVPAAMIDAPALVVPEHGKPIPFMEQATRTLPESALQKGKPVNAKGEEVSEEDSTYTPAAQTPDPLVLTGARPASAYRRTLPVGAEPQPGGPRHASAGQDAKKPA